jgi:exodeoxyribonuclease VIII
MEYKELFESALQGELKGLYKGIPNKVYHQMPGLSSTGIGHMLLSPAHYMAAKNEDRGSEISLGSVAHAKILEPENFSSMIAMREKETSKDGKLANKIALDMGKLLVNEATMETVNSMAAALDNYPKIKEMLSQGESELSGFLPHPEFKFQLKIRPDKLHRAQRVIVDYKTISAGMSSQSLERFFYFQGWHRQAAYYNHVARQLEGRELESYYVFQEVKAPYGVRCFRINEAALEKGWEEVKPVFSRYAECLRTNVWPGYEETMSDLSLPGYALSGEYEGETDV